MAGDDNRDRSNEAPLLKNRYYENCPGCKVDRAKALNKGSPLKHLLNIWMLTMCTTLPISCIFPFIYFMVRDFGIAETEADIGTYAGYLGSSFMLGRGLTSVAWGIVADRYGRKYTILLGTIAITVFNTLFGLCTSFWMAVSTRFLLGGLNGSLGTIMAYCTEILPEEHQAKGLATYSSAWGIALVIGPALGGYLAQPVEKYPHIFPKGSLFDKFPYFLPCLVISAFALIVLVACTWLPETLHNHKVSNDYNKHAEALENDITEKPFQKDGNLFLNWPLMSSIIIYCVFSLHDIAYSEVFSLWAVSPLELGGLNFTTDDVGDVLSISGFALLFYQIFIYPTMEKACGTINLARIAAVLTMPLLQSYPLIAMLSGFTLHLVIAIASVLMLCVPAIIDTCLFLLQNRAVEQHQRGAANGMAMAAMSLFKAGGPALGGAVLSWSQKRLNGSFLPGTHLVFFMLNLIEALGVLMMFKPFLAERKEQLQ
ncbi:protein ZINC INDUCED FACILITATOR-LIKE 1-like isoform X2 [Prosopis cineraria]|uniref:protein ZINC INDUCED FACILITATOR-LIKE 1-like isoform X2 n=1 Tax=Prosopis cineraria TaxID=364024 RepID=UPI00240F9EF3|nr:protein ZINC INDUCED FACILITATOR-LIKE 1-like isoform X2 [Prosopis cineraria]